MNISSIKRCTNFLTDTQFIRNVPIDTFLKNNDSKIILSNYICYSVVIINNQRIVNVIKFLKQTPPLGVCSYYITWYYLENDELLETSFWVHSGVALRKKFFYAEDRMSFLRSTFVYDPITDNLYRLTNLWSYVDLTMEYPIGQFVFNSPKIYYLYKKKINKNKYLHHNFDRKHEELKKSCARLLKTHNQLHYIENNYTKLFKQLTAVIDS